MSPDLKTTKRGASKPFHATSQRMCLSLVRVQSTGANCSTIRSPTMTKKNPTILAPSSHVTLSAGMRPVRARLGLIIIGAVSLLGLTITGCNREPPSATPASPTPSAAAASQAPSEQAKGAVYRCPMHPDVTSDKPGKCSICGMNLVQADSSNAAMPTAMREHTH